MFVFIGLMQLFDWIFWENQDMTDPKQASINYFFTKIAMIVNNTQPIVLAYLIYSYTNTLGELSKIMMIFFTFIFILYTLITFNTIDYTLAEATDSRGKVLNWKWNQGKGSRVFYIVFFITLCLLAYENFNYPINIVFVLMNAITFILSDYYYQSLDSKYKYKFVGRFWCKNIALMPLLFLLFKI